MSSPAREMENTVVCLPIVYGSVAFPLLTNNSSNKRISSAAAAVGDSTHEWTLYLRGPHGEDLSLCIQKVVFHLHPSFSQPVRELTQPPYQVTERGWGEFEAQIRIHWKDINEKSIVVTHGIKLYPPPLPSSNRGTTSASPTPLLAETSTADHGRNNNNNNSNNSDPVVSESYDEVVFTNPSESFFDLLAKIPESHAFDQPDQTPPPQQQQQYLNYLPKYSDANDFLALLEAKKFLSRELASVKDRLVVVENELVSVEDHLRQAVAAPPQQQQQQQQPPSVVAPEDPLLATAMTSSSATVMAMTTSSRPAAKPRKSSSSTNNKSNSTNNNKKSKITMVSDGGTAAPTAKKAKTIKDPPPPSLPPVAPPAPES